MKKLPWLVKFGAVLLLLSAALYSLHYALFGDAHHIWLYLVGDIAFIPVDVFLVTLVIHQLLNNREKRSMLNKLNMVIGVFFSETGNELLGRLVAFSGRADGLRQSLRPATDWPPRRFCDARRIVQEADPDMDCARGDLKGLRSFLLARRDCLMRLLENPNLLEHEAFTDVLWAVVHLTEELAARDLAKPMPEPDSKHLAGDIRRAFERAVSSWLSYALHLRDAYPYLFSLVVRQNPFDPSASAAVAE